MIADLIFLIVLVALALPGLIVCVFEFSGRKSQPHPGPQRQTHHPAPPRALPT